MKKPKVFVAFPSALIEKANKMQLNNFKRLIEHLKNKNISIFCAMEKCKWSVENFDSARSATEIDWVELCHSNHLLACPKIKDVVSGGVHIEIGWAAALGIPTTILCESDSLNHSTLITGMKELGEFNVEVIYYKSDINETREKIFTRIIKNLKETTRY